MVYYLEALVFDLQLKVSCRLSWRIVTRFNQYWDWNLWRKPDCFSFQQCSYVCLILTHSSLPHPNAILRFIDLTSNLINRLQFAILKSQYATSYSQYSSSSTSWNPNPIFQFHLSFSLHSLVEHLHFAYSLQVWTLAATINYRLLWCCVSSSFRFVISYDIPGL